MRMTTKWTVIMMALLAAACASPVRAQRNVSGAGNLASNERSFNRTLNVSGPVDLDVSTGSGTIDIQQHSGNNVEIHGRIRAGSDWFRSDRNIEDVVREIESNPPIEQNGNRIQIGPLPNRIQNISISYSIVVPAQTSVRAHSGSGGETISGLYGRVDATTGSGGITLTDLRGDITSSTGSGHIHAKVYGSLHAHTGSGTITAEGEQEGVWDLETGSGEIEVCLPQNAGFQVNAHTGSGGVVVDRPMTLQGRLDNRQRRDDSGKVGDGSYALDLRTGSGQIRIE